MPAAMAISDEEIKEFNNVTYERIKEMTSIPKLKRLEKYMRDEGFPQTADMARKIILERGGEDNQTNQEDLQRSNLDADFDLFLKNINIWQDSIKGADQQLQGLREAQNLTKKDLQEVESIVPIPRKSKFHHTPPKENGVESKGCNKERSHRDRNEYYKKWDQYVKECEKDTKDQPAEDKGTAHPKRESNLSRHKKLLSFAQTKSTIEREWFAAREREKGNDLFKAKEYTASIERYTLAIELYSQVASTYANRAAAYLKLTRWDDAYLDCCKALEIDPSYTKALMRRGVASLYMDKPENALKDLKSASTLDPTNQEITHLMHDAQKAIAKLKQKFFKDVENKENYEKLVECEGLSVKKKRIAIEEVEELPKTKDLYEQVVHSCGGEVDGPNELNDASLLYPKAKNNNLQQTKDLDCKPTKPLITEVFEEVKTHVKKSEANSEVVFVVQEQVESLDESHKVSEGVAGLLADEWRIKGNKLYSTGDMIQAKDCYIASLKHDPTNVATLSNQALCCLKLEQYNEAEQNASKAIDIDPNNFKCYYHRGCAQRKLGNLTQSRDDFKRVLVALPSDKNVLKELSELEVEIRDGHNMTIEDATPSKKILETKDKDVESRDYLPMRVGPMTFEEIEPQVTITKTSLSNSTKRTWTSLPREKSVVVDTMKQNNDKRMKDTSETRLSKKEKEKQDEQCTISITEASDSISQGFEKCEEAQKEGPAYEKPTTNCTNPILGQSPREPEDEASSAHNQCSGKINKNYAEEQRLKGNDAFKKGLFTIALGCYRKSIDLNPTVATVHANEALCYLKLDQYAKARASCDEALKLDPSFAKAYYRRATAHHKLGNLTCALQDYEVVQKLTSVDKKLEREIEALKKNILLKRMKNQSRTVHFDLSKTEVAEISENETLTPTSTIKYSKECLKKSTQVVRRSVESKVEEVGSGESESRVEDPNKVACSSSEQVKKEQEVIEKPNSKGMLNQQPALPQPPNTAFEFERGCIKLQDELELLHEYVSQVDSDMYPRIFKESLSVDIMRLVAKIICKAYMPNEPRGAIRILQGLAKVKRFKLALMLLSHEDKKLFASIFRWLGSAHDKSQEDDLIKLAKDYNM